MDAQLKLWEYPEGRPGNGLKERVCSYSGYSEMTTQVVHRLEVVKSRVVVIIGFGDKLQLTETTDRTANMSCQAFAVSLQSSPLKTCKTTFALNAALYCCRFPTMTLSLLRTRLLLLAPCPKIGGYYNPYVNQFYSVPYLYRADR
ncbi:hypothetical protein S7335_869 [Synechococcus sp. PCC 7335]|nr:hypothetical protein S7335_869 [Synechococcus sp. PCC 7335]